MKSRLGLATALTWIVGSMLIVPGTVYNGYCLLKSSSFFAHHTICRIIQTTPQYERLSTSYLAYLMNLSADQPTKARQFNLSLAKTRLEASPVIKQAHVALIQQDTVYIDYTIRHPIAWIEDYENMAVGEDRVLFPIAPFFSPKKLPRIYLGLSPEDALWGKKIDSYQLELAFQCLKTLDLLELHVQKIDVSKALFPSLGQREIVVILEEEKHERILRLTPKDFAQEMGNYLELRQTLDAASIVVDLRIPQVAFITS
ncbi:MAG: hypothetical protein QRY72_02215 [Candidatus Rhabdochlamydia sp.]